MLTGLREKLKGLQSQDASSATALTEDEKRLVYLLTAGFDLKLAAQNVIRHAKKTHDRKLIEQAIEQGTYKVRWADEHLMHEAFSINLLGVSKAFKAMQAINYTITPDGPLPPYPTMTSKALFRETEEFAARIETAFEKVFSRLDSMRSHTDYVHRLRFEVTGQDIDKLQAIHDEMKSKISMEEVQTFRKQLQGEAGPFVVSSIELMEQEWKHPSLHDAGKEADAREGGGDGNYTGKLKQKKPTEREGPT